MPNLTDRLLKALNEGDGSLTDTNVRGLLYTPTGKGRGLWSVRYTSPELKTPPKRAGEPETAMRRAKGVGAYPLVTLEDARKAGREVHEKVKAGIDPLEEDKRAAVRAAQGRNVPTFREAAVAMHKEKQQKWKKTGEFKRNSNAWISNVTRYFAPILDRRVDTLTKFDFEQALLPQWYEYPDASDKALRRANAIMKKCKARDHVAVNVVDDVPGLMPEHSKEATAIEHHPSMAWQDAPAYIAAHLADIAPTDIDRAAVFVLMHTAVRPGEVRGMRWTELNLDAATWVIPAARMKASKDHHVTLPPDVVALLRRMAAAKLHKDFVFPNMGGTNIIQDLRLQRFLHRTEAPSRTPGRVATPHGFRATFTDWTVDHDFNEKTADRQLAHKPKGQVAQAYERTDQYHARRRLMNRYADFLAGRWESFVLSEDADNVIPFKPASAA